MESLKSINNKRKKYRKERIRDKQNGPVIIIAQSIHKEPPPLVRKVLNIPNRPINIGSYTPIEVEYEDRNGIPRVYIEPSWEELTLDQQRRERKRLLPKHSDLEMMYELYGEVPK